VFANFSKAFTSHRDNKEHFSKPKSLQAIDTRKYAVIDDHRPDFTLIPSQFKIENIAAIHDSSGLAFISQGFIEVKYGKLEDGHIGQLINYHYMAHKKMKHRKVFIGALTNFEQIRFVKSDFSTAGAPINYVTDVMPLFDVSNIHNIGTTYRCNTPGLKYLFSMFVDVDKSEYLFDIPEVTLVRFLGKGATSIVYQIKRGDEEFAMKLCNSVENILHLEREI